LEWRDRSRAGLAAHLEARGVAPQARRDALGTLERAGYVDDARFATRRADALASRGYGDAAIRFDLQHHGLHPARIDDALAALPPEERRAAELVSGAGDTARTARRLAARGFDPDTIAAVLGLDA